MNMMEVRGLCKSYGKAGRKICAVFNVDLTIRKGEILGLVGESGCGKSTLGRLLLRLEKPTRGRITFEGADITGYSYGQMRRIRRQMQLVFQGSANSFNPYFMVGRILGEPLDNYCKLTAAEKEREITAMLERVGLGGEYLGRYSSELSGGQRQRVGIARALILNPRFVVCDEAVSSVDYALKKQILTMLVSLKKQNGSTYLFISHDITAVNAVCDRVAVMYLGNILEILPQAGAEALHPYTQALLAAALAPDPRVRNEKRVLLKEDGERRPPERGCVFQSRCLYCQEECLASMPLLTEISEGHFAACHFVRR